MRVHACVCKRRMFSVKLNMCICVSVSETKGEDRLVLTYNCMCMYMCVSWYVWVFDPSHNYSVYKRIICRHVPVCRSVYHSLWIEKLRYLYSCVKYKWIKVRYFKFITGQIKFQCMDVSENATPWPVQTKQIHRNYLFILEIKYICFSEIFFSRS